MRRAALAVLGALACGAGEQTGRTLAGDSVTAGGDVALDSAAVGTVFHGVKYPLTSDNYRRWLVAQEALDSLEEPTGMPRIDVRDPTDDDIEHTVAFLQEHEDERAAIERSGLSVRDFVLTSIALGQAFNFRGDDLVPSGNRAFVDSNRAQIGRAREARRFHVLDDDGDDSPGRGHGRGKGKGHGHKHGHRHK